MALRLNIDSTETAKRNMTDIIFYMNLDVVTTNFYPLLNLQYVIWLERFENMIEIVHTAKVLESLKFVWHVSTKYLCIMLWPCFISTKDTHLK